LAEQFEGHSLLVTDAVLLEIGNALACSYKQEAVAIIEQFLTAAEVEVVHLTPHLFTQGFALYKSYQDKAWGLVHCISFFVMRETGVHQALTFEQHFVQAGFQALMRELPRT
jgi:predicted nucleic acid-binding protein